jgi:hypothetical protein
MDIVVFKPKYSKTPWIIAAVAYVLFTIFGTTIIASGSDSSLDMLAMVFFIAMAVLFLALLMMTMFINYPRSIEFGDSVVLRRRFIAPVAIRYDEIQYDEARRVKIGAMILSVSDIENQSELEILMQGLLDKGLISAQPFAAARGGKFAGGKGRLLFWIVFTVLFFANTFLVQDSMHTQQVVITLILYFSCIVYMVIAIMRGFRK